MNYNYIRHYPEQVIQQVKQLVESNKLSSYLTQKYPQIHAIQTDQLLYQHIHGFKNQYMKKSGSLSKIVFDKKIKDAANSLGTHRYVSRVQGNKLKAKNEIRIATFFKQAPLEFLNMIAVHELAHLKEKEHNKAFYQLCLHMLPEYHQLELDTRLYLMYYESDGSLY